MPAPYQPGQVMGLSGPAGSAELPPAWASDPILMQIQALAQQNMAAAEAGALAHRQQALIAYGYSPELGSLYGDENTRKAAEGNSFSELATLKRNHDLRQQGLNENLNRSNLWYSSTRGQELGKEGTQYLGEQALANQRLRAGLSGIASNLLAAKQTSQGQVLQGQQDAYTRYLQQQLQYAGAPRGQITAAPSTRRRPARPRRII